MAQKPLMVMALTQHDDNCQEIKSIKVPLETNKLEVGIISSKQKMRKAGGGRQSLWEKDQTLIRDLEKLIAPATRGDPSSPLLWISKSTRKLATTLKEMRHKIIPFPKSHATVRRASKM